MHQHHRSAKVSSLLFCGLLLLSTVIFASTDNPAHVVYMSPSQSNDPFDKNVIALMQAAAEDLDLRLTVVNVVKNQVYNQQRIDNIFKLAPDYLVISYQIYTHKVLRQAEILGIKVMIINSPIPDSERHLMGRPRSKFSNWIGHIYPDDYLAGHQLTQLLQQQLYHTNETTQPHQNPAELLAFNGHRATSSARERKRGLMDAALALDIHIRNIYAADWDPDITTRSLPAAAIRYPNVKLFWAGSDAIALRIIEHQKARAMIAGKDFYTAGIDWSEAALVSIINGEMSASIGGHFLVGAWAMVQIYDYHQGQDFITLGTETIVPMAIADRSNAEHILATLKAQPWRQIDFKNFTRGKNKNFYAYDFKVENIFGDLPIDSTPSKRSP